MTEGMVLSSVRKSVVTEQQSQSGPKCAGVGLWRNMQHYRNLPLV